MQKNNLVEIINYEVPESDIVQTINDLKTRANCIVKTFSQQELLGKYENWNWIKHNQLDINIYQKYTENSQSIEIYYDHENAEEMFGDRFWFDKGLVYAKDKISNEASDFQLIKLGKKFEVDYLNQWIPKDIVNLPKGSQGFEVFNQIYKIVWSYDQTLNFYFSDKKIMIPMGLAIITSNNKSEILYLISLFRSKLCLKILKLTTGNNDNDRYIGKVGVSAIKNFIRVPILNTPEKLELKQKLILKAQDLLESENTHLENLVEFDDYDIILPQKFDYWAVHDGNLFLTLNNYDYWFEIKNKANETTIYQALETIYGEPVKVVENGIELNQLKKTVIFDKNRQSKIKNEMDKMVFELYEMSDFLNEI